MVSIVSDSCTEQAFGGGRDLVKCQGGRSKRQRVEARLEEIKGVVDWIFTDFAGTSIFMKKVVSIIHYFYDSQVQWPPTHPSCLTVIKIVNHGDRFFPHFAGADKIGKYPIH